MSYPASSACPNDTRCRLLQIISALDSRRETTTHTSLWQSLVRTLQSGTGDHWATTAPPLIRLCLHTQLHHHDHDVPLAAFRVLYHMTLNASCRPQLTAAAPALLRHAVVATQDQRQPLLRAVAQNVVLRMVMSVLTPGIALQLLTETLEQADAQRADLVRFFSWAVEEAGPESAGEEWIQRFMAILEARFLYYTTLDQRRVLILVRRMKEKMGEAFWAMAREPVARMLREAGGMCETTGRSDSRLSGRASSRGGGTSDGEMAN